MPEVMMIALRKYLLASIVIAAVALFCRSSHQADGPSAMFRNGPSHSGVYISAEIAGFGGLQWRFQTGGAVRSSPVIARDVLYVGSSDGHIYAIDANTGGERWRFDAGSAVTSTPAVVNGSVYSGTYDGRLLALDAASGKALWSLKTGPDAPLAWGYESGDFFSSSPTVYGEKVLYGGGDGFLYALESSTGRELWKAKTGGRIRSSPAVDRGVVFFGSFDGSLYAVDLESGRQKWRYETEGGGLNSGEFGYDRK
ncbi:MAG TPA: PQQ-binding-like beta-propeller repeat protein, partial [Pyrinomonadaceae bacterium]|nr:PQQ-binding-like beta-propeller repeat protein [Pyrinomonadaceae bacterium]